MPLFQSGLGQFKPDYALTLKMKTIEVSKINKENINELIAKELNIPITPERESVDIDAREICYIPAHYNPYYTCTESILKALKNYNIKLNYYPNLGFTARVASQDSVEIGYIADFVSASGAICLAFLESKGYKIIK